MQRAAGRSNGFRKKASWSCCFGLLLLASACSSAGLAPDSAETAEVAAPGVDAQLEVRMAAILERHLQITTDAELGIYLRGVAESLVRGQARLAARPLGVIVVQDRGRRWESYSIPGTRVYLSRGLLKTLEFESEIAALIALQLSHVALGHPRPAELWNPGMTEGEIFGPSGALAFGERQVIAAVESSARMLYTAGIDPRGLVSLCARLQNGGTSSPYDPVLLEKMRTRAREVLAQFAPLRNPVIRSEAFFTARERIRRL